MGSRAHETKIREREKQARDHERPHIDNPFCPQQEAFEARHKKAAQGRSSLRFSAAFISILFLFLK